MNHGHSSAAPGIIITEILEPMPTALPTVNARISPRGGLDVLSRGEIARLRDASSGGLHELLRRCALAVLTVGSDSDDPRAAQMKYPDFDIQVHQQDRGIKIELKHAPALAFVDGEIIRGVAELLYAVVRDIAYVAIEINGSGKFDMATDGVDLVAVYRENRDAIRGMHPFSDEEIEALETNSEWLIEHLTPDGARAEAKKKSPAEDVRDRLWTLMLRRHPHLRKIGYYLHGDDVDLYVPKLQSRVAQAILEEETGEEPPSPDKPEGQDP